LKGEALRAANRDGLERRTRSTTHSRPSEPRPKKEIVLDPCRIFAGNASRALAESICRRLKVPLGDADVCRFEDGEVSVKFNENIRGGDVFVIQATGAPADNLMELLVMLDAAKRASARRVTAVLPYFGYARQDRKDQPRAPITAKLVANLITVAGADRALTMDLHSAQIQGFFDIPLDHLYAAPILIDHFAQCAIPNLVVVAPDVGGVKMARAYAKRLGADLALTDKRRPRPDSVEIMNIIGDVKGKNAVLFDDVVTTAGTLCQAAEAIRKQGAKDIYAGVTHGVFSPGADERIAQSPIKELVITDTVNHSDSLPPKVKVLSVAGLLGEAVQRIHEERSLSSLFV
jgi:ribose-phosphate pyrophosphokinase